MSEKDAEAKLKAFQKRHKVDLMRLGEDYWAIRTRTTDTDWRHARFLAELFSDPDNQPRLRRVTGLPLVRELFEACDISFSRAAQLLGMSPEELRIVAQDDGWKPRCPAEAAWWADGQGDESLPWDEPKRMEEPE